jgi:hypothetical protein
MTSAATVKIVNIIGGMAAIVIGGTMLILGASFLYKSASIAVPMVVGSWNYHNEKRVAADEITSEVVAIRDRWFRIECGEYYDNWFVYRKLMMRDRVWCEDPKYVDQLK